VAFFGTGLFFRSGIIGSGDISDQPRGRVGLGVTYNGARTMSSVAPLVIGRVGQARGLSWAFYLCAAAYLLAALVATQLPGNEGKRPAVTFTAGHAFWLCACSFFAVHGGVCASNELLHSFAGLPLRQAHGRTHFELRLF